MTSGRHDFTLLTFVVRQLGLENLLSHITRKLQTIMKRPQPVVRTHNVVYVPIGSQAQKWHYDDDIRHMNCKNYSYFTILIHLNSIDNDCGGTEVRLIKDDTSLTDLVSQVIVL
jgi:hypothetical protein